MLKFQVGDIVRVVGHLAYNGMITEVTSISRNIKEYVYCTPVYNFLESEIALVQPAPQASGPSNTIFEAADILTMRKGFSSLCGGWFNPGILAENIFNKKCECGSHAVGVDRHSDYCPLYSKD